jgi:hypothetical protein
LTERDLTDIDRGQKAERMPRLVRHFNLSIDRIIKCTFYLPCFAVQQVDRSPFQLEPAASVYPWAPLTDRGDQSGALVAVALGSNCIKHLVYRLAYNGDVVCVQNGPPARRLPIRVNLRGRDHDRKGEGCRKSIPQRPDESSRRHHYSETVHEASVSMIPAAIGQEILL